MPRQRWWRVAAIAATLSVATQAPVLAYTCPSGYSYYNDTAGVPASQEGADSCVMAVNTTSTSWTTASTTCPSSGHLLSITSMQAKATNALYNFAYTLAAGAGEGWGRCSVSRWTEGGLGFENRGVALPIVWVTCVSQLQRRRRCGSARPDPPRRGNGVIVVTRRCWCVRRPRATCGRPPSRGKTNDFAATRYC